MSIDLYWHSNIFNSYLYEFLTSFLILSCGEEKKESLDLMSSIIKPRLKINFLFVKFLVFFLSVIWLFLDNADDLAELVGEE